MLLYRDVPAGRMFLPMREAPMDHAASSPATLIGLSHCALGDNPALSGVFFEDAQSLAEKVVAHAVDVFFGCAIYFAAFLRRGKVMPFRGRILPVLQIRQFRTSRFLSY
jgi:hypothetical protein